MRPMPDISAGRNARARSNGRRRSASTSSSTASSSATTWSNISASSSPASPSPAPAGCKATARAASVRRSSMATSRAPRPMTVDWWRYAQDQTGRPMKGMLTGPVTILNWSFVRDDQPRAESCRQIALAIRDEVHDLEAAGAAIDPDRRSRTARRPAAAPLRMAVLPRLGGRKLPHRLVGRPRRHADPHRICAIRSSTTSSARSARWTPT